MIDIGVLITMGLGGAAGCIIGYMAGVRREADRHAQRLLATSQSAVDRCDREMRHWDAIEHGYIGAIITASGMLTHGWSQAEIDAWLHDPYVDRAWQRYAMHKRAGQAA